MPRTGPVRPGEESERLASWGCNADTSLAPPRAKYSATRGKADERNRLRYGGPANPYSPSNALFITRNGQASGSGPLVGALFFVGGIDAPDPDLSHGRRFNALCRDPVGRWVREIGGKLSQKVERQRRCPSADFQDVARSSKRRRSRDPGRYASGRSATVSSAMVPSATSTASRIRGSRCSPAPPTIRPSSVPIGCLRRSAGSRRDRIGAGKAARGGKGTRHRRGRPLSGLCPFRTAHYKACAGGPVHAARLPATFLTTE